MKNKTKIKALGIAAIFLGGVLLTSCTANFCNNEDKAHMAYPYEQGVTLYVDKADYEELKTNENTAKLITSEEEKGIAGPAFVDDDGTILNQNVYKYIPYEVSEDGKLTFTANKAQSLLQPNVIDQAASSGYMMPSVEYWAAIDDFVLNAATYLSEVESPLVSYDPENPTFSEASPEYIAELTVDDINPYKDPNEVDASGKLSEPNNDSILRNYGYVKFTGKDDVLFGYLKQWNAMLYASDDPDLGMDNVPTEDFFNAYCNAISTKVNANRSCIATQDGFFGHYGAHSDWEVAITKKSWGYAWSKGFLEGLLVYPVSWLLDTFAFSMDPALSGFGQILALVFVTLIVRGFIMLVSFKSTMDTQKMQALQPELAKIQAKYPNSNTNQAEKARLGQEQMALYKRNKIHPFRQIIVLIIQFPIFICVWSGLQGSAALSTGEFLNMRLSDTISTILFNTAGSWYYNVEGWWTALVLFILMAGVQIMSMMLPRIIAKYQSRNVSKMGKNPAQTSQQKQMKWISIFMMGFTIVMGFFLPSAMAIYWLIGGLISMAQTGITQLVIAKSKKKHNRSR